MNVDIYEINRNTESNRWIYETPKHVMAGINKSEIKKMFCPSKYIHIKPPYFTKFLETIKEVFTNGDVKCVVLSGKQLFVVVKHNEEISASFEKNGDNYVQ
jgi:hypothetical protein